MTVQRTTADGGCSRVRGPPSDCDRVGDRSDPARRVARGRFTMKVVQDYEAPKLEVVGSVAELTTLDDGSKDDT